jgi:hypothetical protein
MGTMFKKAAPAKVEAPKKKGKEKEQIAISGLQQLTLLDALIKQASAMKATIQSDVTAAGFGRFVELQGNSTRPSSFEGVDGHATASVEVRKRSSASVLTEEEVKILDAAGIKAEVKVVTPFQFYINPAYVNDEKLLGKVEAALSKIVPEDFIQQQQEVSKPVVGDAMLDDAFRNKAGEEVLRILTTMAVKPKLNESYNMDNLITDALEIMQPSKKASKPSIKVVK